MTIRTVATTHIFGVVVVVAKCWWNLEQDIKLSTSSFTGNHFFPNPFTSSGLSPTSERKKYDPFLKSLRTPQQRHPPSIERERSLPNSSTWTTPNLLGPILSFSWLGRRSEDYFSLRLFCFVSDSNGIIMTTTTERCITLDWLERTLGERR